MPKYNCASMAQYFRMLKEDIMQAAEGRAFSGRWIDGKREFVGVYKGDALRIIDESVDEIVHHAVMANATGATMQNMYEINVSGLDILRFGMRQHEEYCKWWREYAGDTEDGDEDASED